MKLTDEQIADARDNAGMASGNTIRALATEVLESRAALAAKDARIAELEGENEAALQIISLLDKAEDVWADYGSGFRIHFSFGPQASPEIVRLVNERRARAALGRDAT